MVDALCTTQKLGQFFEEIFAWVGLFRVEVRYGSLDAGPKARPGFGRRITGLDEEAEGRPIASG